ncbi:hypothetical protein CWC05_03495 [Pseudoalteromonas ruthenica]|uniref:Uncharacterized protein n=1 Tax=Pseudoalteromonas ruthenica TaxID=151081 RepID=A0A5S3ZA86_9GAMM|nr:hypothetical protein [Pseudoalteromonas ruthenica]TMP88506.1 hypothetical protein CWC05_03495 [Pseudoalteromonas ruthenica]
MIALNGVKVPGSNTRVHANFDLAGTNQSGVGSFAITSEEGTKPKGLTISTVLRMDELDALERITRWAEAENDYGERQVYTITNELAQSMKIRRAKFAGKINVKEDQTLKAWNLTFKLVEVKSVAEKKQQQLDETNKGISQSPAKDGHAQTLVLFEAAEGQ